MRWPAWLVRTIIFGGLGVLLLIAIGGRVRADRALARADEVSRLGTPGEVAARAQQMASVWAGEPAVVISVERERRHWRAVAMAGPSCYELAVGEGAVVDDGECVVPALECRPHRERRVANSLEAIEDHPVSIDVSFRNFPVVRARLSWFARVGQDHALLELAKRVIRLAGSSSSIVFQPLPVDDPKIRQPDITRARTLLGWEPRVDVDEGLRQTIEWFRHKLDR